MGIVWWESKRRLKTGTYEFLRSHDCEAPVAQDLWCLEVHEDRCWRIDIQGQRAFHGGSRPYTTDSMHVRPRPPRHVRQILSVTFMPVTPSLMTVSHSPLSLSCVTEKASSNRPFSSFTWLDFRPVATEALGSRPAYMTCRRLWFSV